jgi:heme/copper-type cytochrome/quinol oxidase subunit 4
MKRIAETVVSMVPTLVTRQISPPGSRWRVTWSGTTVTRTIPATLAPRLACDLTTDPYQTRPGQQPSCASDRETKGGLMRQRTGFTLAELLTVIAIIVLVVSLFLPSVQTVKRQANSVSCRSNLRQWAHFFFMYTQNNHDRFFMSLPDTQWRFWGRSMQPYYQGSPDICFCPMAPVLANPTGTAGAPVIGSKSLAWGRLAEDRGLFGSYGTNYWLCDNRCTSATCWHRQCWKSIFAKNAGSIPVFLDCLLPAGRPDSRDGPPPWEDGHAGVSGECWMSHFSINRHEGYINGAFMDWSVRKVGLKELWTLKWHQSFNTAGLWTTAGGVGPEDWPKWMRRFRSY